MERGKEGGREGGTRSTCARVSKGVWPHTRRWVRAHMHACVLWVRLYLEDLTGISI